LSLDSFYSGKRVLVTGHTGFKGSWLSIWLQQMGAEVFGYSLAPKTERDNFVLLGGENQISGIFDDIRDIERLKKTFSDFKPEIVFHLAAQPLVLESYSDPYGTFDVNFRGTLNILEVFRNDPNFANFGVHYNG
jgi:CDP-glucose 4,6-dehydratase